MARELPQFLAVLVSQTAITEKGFAMLKVPLTFSLLLFLALSGSVFADEINFSGTITLDDGLLASGNWNNGPTTLSWEVDHPVEGVGFGHATFYSYAFDHPSTSTFEFIIEAHENMVLGEIFDVNSTLPNYEIGYFDSSSHPGLPDTIYGYRFWGDSGNTVDTITFVSDFYPMWGDFFSSGLDIENYAWNEGFLNPDIDPGPPIGNGSLGWNILVPGGGGLAVIPEPHSPMLLMVIFLSLIGRSR